MNLANIIGDSAPAIAITSGLTQSLKAALPAAIQDRVAYLTTIAAGLLVTGGFDYALLSPATPQDWVIVALHGLVVGLSAAGLYKTAAAIAAKANSVTTPTMPERDGAPPRSSAGAGGDLRKLAEVDTPKT